MVRMPAARLACLVVAFGCAGAASAQSATTDSVIAKALNGQRPGRINVIVKAGHELTAKEEAAIRRLGGYVYRHLTVIDSSAVSIPHRKLRKLVSLPFVKHVSSDETVRKNDLFTVGSTYASTAWTKYGANGAGVGVAVLDSGIAASNDFNGSAGSRISAAVNFSTETGPYDMYGHGTHVAGIIAGNGANSSGPGAFQTYFGIAPQSGLVNVRVLDSVGNGSVSQVCAGIQWVINQRTKYNIRVMNLSLGHAVGESYLTDPLCQALERAWKSGIVVVCAAGNRGRLHETPTDGDANEGYGTGYGTIDSPGNDPYVITVGATKSIDGNRANDQIATYSSRGPTRLDFIAKPDIVAPGNRIVSVLANGGSIDQAFGDIVDVPWTSYTTQAPADYTPRYMQMSGTSMATPVVAGAAALMLQRDPTLSPDTVKARLMASATKWAFPDGQGSIVTFGAGYLDIVGALKSSVVATKSAKSPYLVWSPSGTINIVTDPDFWGTGLNGIVNGILDLLLNPTYRGDRAMWGDSAIGSPRAMWGDGVGPIASDRALWGERAMWGDTTTTDQPVASAGVGPTMLKGDK
ncbi:S8 family peptidase [Fimbriimonas ginsengisoli]|uniref:Intracellular alkaline serine proteinase n=1 Tax=Fimbriimonas ginsengisoli Gsoil 348 TaxID=661478 RepID=A0A068NYU7_FIMGI|nr:S8 family peptidase [Fimbriimonas ginsengisoli]AIE87444.1 intracellular alkaline serine proteinase [Fimbriimonas ginsengisoli Gsoil 348]